MGNVGQQPPDVPADYDAKDIPRDTPGGNEAARQLQLRWRQQENSRRQTPAPGLLLRCASIAMAWGEGTTLTLCPKAHIFCALTYALGTQVSGNFPSWDHGGGAPAAASPWLPLQSGGGADASVVSLRYGSFAIAASPVV